MLSVAAVIELTRTVVYLIYGVRLKVKIDWIIINIPLIIYTVNIKYTTVRVSSITAATDRRAINTNVLSS